jgi:hypothetical protein
MSTVPSLDGMNSHTTSTVTEPIEPLTYEKIRAAIEAIGPEPIGEFMKAQGFDPKEGGRLALPASWKDRDRFWPEYVTFTEMTGTPFLYTDISLWLKIP